MIHVEHFDSFCGSKNGMIQETNVLFSSEVLAKFDFSKAFIYATYADGSVLIYITDLINNNCSFIDLQDYKTSFKLLQRNYQDFFIAHNGNFFQVSKSILYCFLEYYFDLNSQRLSSE